MEIKEALSVFFFFILPWALVAVYGKSHDGGNQTSARQCRQCGGQR